MNSTLQNTLVTVLIGAAVYGIAQVLGPDWNEALKDAATLLITALANHFLHKTTAEKVASGLIK